MAEHSRDQVHAMRGAVCKRDAARLRIDKSRELLAYLLGLAEPTLPRNVAMLCHFVVVAFAFASSEN